MSDDFDMPDAALLPEGDPVRKAWEEKIAGMSPEAQAQWRALTGQAAAVRESMRGISLPEGIEAQLLALREDRGEMETAALLSPHDPIRQEWEARAAAGGAGGGGGESGDPDRWRQLVNESDALRAGLVAGADLPPRLRTRLLSVPGKRSVWQISPVIRWAAAAVAAVLLFLAGSALWNLHLATIDRRVLRAVAAVAVAQHPTPPGLLVESNDLLVVRETLMREDLGMTPMILAGGTNLTGGGVTTIDGKRAYFTLWKVEGHPFTLYQFKPDTFGLRENFAHDEEVVSAPAPAAAPCRVWSWSAPDHHCGWLLVTTGTSVENPFVW